VVLDLIYLASGASYAPTVSFALIASGSSLEGPAEAGDRSARPRS
jgi:hypothetical protein